MGYDLITDTDEEKIDLINDLLKSMINNEEYQEMIGESVTYDELVKTERANFLDNLHTRART